MKIQITTQSFIYLMLLGLLWTVFALSVVVFAKMIFEKIKGDKQIVVQQKERIDRLNNDKRQLLYALEALESDRSAIAEIKKEMNEAISNPITFKYEPSPQSKKLDSFFSKFQIETF